ncbi:hypothetical protein MOO45_05485 [Bombilactobacillus folatiphilus]|uniref:Uncharacterized protein n=1 Tax=Bombilactobacillus folatiphilus TaxID=2923362 RepID=A0ABY4P7M4_9LACO|nr:hypothetical protein [Bombilactobacillus folatiphilus]UQS81657.1 hypothetical protein MOO45_05485 [Bombilactobacillus folatiphilus]
MIYYLQFNMANLPGVIQVSNQLQQTEYILLRQKPRWKVNYELSTPSQETVGQIYQTNMRIWPNYQIILDDQKITKLIHLNNTRHQLMIAPTLHWLISGNLVANNYLVHDFKHHLIMSMDNIYLKNGHEGYLLQIVPQIDIRLGFLIAAVLNQTSRQIKNQQSIKNWRKNNLRVKLSNNYNFKKIRER